ncbi:MAG: DNA mismatch repair protein [Myxococcales bacterium]|nr:DNA mismatch repair protein [Myxococcales bacterium]
MLPAPDLLTAEPAVRVDLHALRQSLVFAFAAGGSFETFDDAIAKAALPATRWGRASFARDIYLDEIVERSLSLRIEGRAVRTCGRYLARVIGEPPRDPGHVEVRRRLLSELAASPTLRTEAEAVYRAIVQLRTLLCTPRQISPRARRVEILRSARDAFELLARSFEAAESALSRARAFARAVVATEGYRRLVAFLDHDEHLASLELQVRVGADGEVRSMEIVSVREQRGNPFYVSALRRLFARLVLLFRGYRTTGAEVAERLLSDVFSGIEEPAALLFQLLGDLEPYLASLTFRDRAAEKGLAVALPALSTDGALELEGLFNPLLFEAGIVPVTCDIRARPGALVIVTGPNSGGKTRLLQAIVTAQLLGESGLFAPVRAARLPRASGLFASLFEEARPDQPEGHLGMELLRIRRMFDELDEGALVVIDELCSGTNPSEGEEIARLVLSLLPELGVQAFVTTHLLQFAAKLSDEATNPALAFLQVELDGSERPTYRFVSGVAHTSLAHRTAARLGVTREELLSRIAAKRQSRALRG